LAAPASKQYREAADVEWRVQHRNKQPPSNGRKSDLKVEAVAEFRRICSRRAGVFNQVNYNWRQDSQKVTPFAVGGSKKLAPCLNNASCAPKSSSLRPVNWLSLTGSA